VARFSWQIYVHFLPRFHHDFVHNYHAKNHVVHAQKLKTPLKNREITGQKKI